MAYPSVVTSFSTKANGQTIDASDVNNVQTDVVAIETFVGTLSSVAGTLINDIRSASSNGGGHVQTANKGGTGQTSYTKGDVLVASSSSVLSKVAVGSDSQILTADSSQTSGVKWAAPATVKTIFGSGADGTVTFNGSSVLGITPVSSVYTLTRDIYVDTATINVGNTVQGPYRIFAKTLLTNNGTISANGLPGSPGTNAGGSGGLGGGGGSVLGASGTIYSGLAGSAGGNGSTGTNTNGQPGTVGVAQTESIGVVGVAGTIGVNGGQTSGGAAGAAGGLTTSLQSINNINFAILMRDFQGENTVKYIKGPSGSGGSGGGGGNDSNGDHGGGGGGSGSTGGMVFICAATLTNNGTISANGGAGGNGGNGSHSVGTGGVGGSGGSGGSGGVIVLIYSGITLGNVTVSGGTVGSAGTGAGGGANGNPGNAGTTGSIYQFNVN